MNLHQCFFTKSDCYKTNLAQQKNPTDSRYANFAKTVKGVMVHSTGANNNKLRRYVAPDDGLLGTNLYQNDWNRSGINACVHGFIGLLKDNKTIATYQTLPFSMRGWHGAGSASDMPNGNCNDMYLSFEVQEDALTDAAYFALAYQEAVEFTAHICKQMGFDPSVDGVIIDHSEGHKRGIASNHGDVAYWFKKFGKSMDTFRAAVVALMAKKPEQPGVDALQYLAETGRISNAAYWQGFLGSVKYLTNVFDKWQVDASSAGTWIAPDTLLGGKEAIALLADNGRLTAPDYWLAKLPAVKYLDVLFGKWAADVARLVK